MIIITTNVIFAILLLIIVIIKEVLSLVLLKPIMSLLLAFPILGAVYVRWLLRFHWLLGMLPFILIGCYDYFGFSLTKILKS